MKFKDLFNLNKEAMLPDAERVRKRVLNRRAKTVRTVIAGASACAAVLLVVAVVAVSMSRGVPTELQEVTGTVNIIESVVPTDKSAAGMKVGSSLKIKTTEDVSVEEMKARLTVSPETEYRIRKSGACEYELEFSEALKEGTLYNVEAVYNGKTVYRWAFQTEKVFCVTNAMPENETYVSLDSAIEVTFSHADVSGFEEAFEITPALEGTFEHYGRTWAFVPTKPMESHTLYTVTVKKDVAGPDGMSLERDYVFSFTTAQEGAYAYLIYQNEAADTFLADEAPIAAICYDQVDASAADVRVYRLADSAAYIDAYKKYVRNGEVSPEIAALAGETYQKFTVTPALTTDYNSIYSKAAFINYPEPLPLGYYFAEIQFGGRKLYQLLQSTTLSVYTITTNGDYTVWVNDTKTGRPVSGAKLSLDGFKEKKTGDMGIAAFSGADEELDVRFLTVDNGEYPYVAALNGGAYDKSIARQNSYYTYISTNSRLYKASDTVEVFGMILPRKSGAKLPGELTLECNFTDEKIPVKVGSNGYFSASVSLNNTAVDYGYIDLYLDGIWLTSTGFNVADYELPTYLVTVSTDRNAYHVGDTVNVTAQVTYMDGTPASDVYVRAENVEIGGYTDANGCLTAALTAECFDSNYYYDANYPEVHNLRFSVEDGTDAYYSGEAPYLVFNSRYYLQGSYTNGTLRVSADTVDLTQIKLESDQLYTAASHAETFKGSPASLSLTGELHELTYIKTPNGTSYDAINKKVVYSWQYEEQDTLVRTFEMTVADGTGTVAIAEKPDENKNYYVILRVSSEDDAAILKTYLTDYNYVGGNQQTYNLVADKTSVNIGDSVQLLVRRGSDNEAINSGSVLYTAVSGEIVENFHSASARFTLKFKESFAPDVLIYGAYFDGKHVFSLGFEMLQYDYENARLKIEMEKDQEKYQPGDKVTLNFRVTDQAGKPVSAMLNLSVLDRALYLIGGEPMDPLSTLYHSRCYSTGVYTTCSHREFTNGEGGGGEGGGDGGETRADFEDTPYFDTVWTGSDGKATVSFTLPDTITEWKVIARAISENAEAGNEVFALRSTQDFFAQVSMAESVKATDDFTVAVKGDGAKAEAGADCTFKVGVTDRDGNAVNTLSATAAKSQYAYLNFGRLEPGVYTVYIQAECGTLQDSLIKTVTVEAAQAAVWVHHQQAVDGTLSLNLTPQKGNVTLTVVDEQQAFWQSAMARLRNNAGRRVDQVLGQYLTEQFYATGVWMDRETLDFAVLDDYTHYNGVKLTPDAEESDLKLSAKMAAVAPEFCDTEDLKWSFEWYLNNRYAARVDVMTSYFGLAALGEPVLADLQVLYTTQSDLSLEESAYLALAFAYSGDYDTARYIYDTKLKNCITVENGMAYAVSADGLDEDLTGCCALLSNRLSLEHCEELIHFILETDTQYTLLNLELISYLNDHVTDTVGENTVTISTGDGRNESYTYQKMGVLVLNLSPEQAANIRIMSVKGQSVVSYAYSGKLEDLRQLGGSSKPEGVEIPTSLAVGARTQITLRVEIPEDYELPMLEMTLPAGLRFESGTVQTKDWEYAVSSRYNARSVTAPLLIGSNTVILEICGALPGSYELEPMVITNSADGRFIATDSVQITITQE